MNCDVAIIGGGPAGSTVGSLLKKYKPELDIVILEREHFPRDHVGESQLPAIPVILDEMGAWDKVEAAGFPIKIGGTYKWGRTADLWDLEFVPGAKFSSEGRPAKYQGQRKETAWQIDRSIYDKILLDHAASLGCRTYEGVRVNKVQREGDRVLGLEVGAYKGEEDNPGFDSVQARYYIDASGDSGILRRTMEVETDYPTALRNIAIWDYWQDAEWAVKIGEEGTRIQVMSIGWGWLWFIAISDVRTSVGLVLPAERFKESGKTTEEIYLQAISEEPLIAHLLQNARREEVLQATRDWSFVASRTAGENWFLSGDSCGFADPILSAGMTLAHTSGRKVAYTILELEKGEQDPQWLKEQYDSTHREQIRHHIRFADYWYSANTRFTDLREYCSEIAKSAGLSLGPNEAFRWMGTGGFALEEPGVARMGTFRVGSLKYLAQFFAGEKVDWSITKYNRFKLNLVGAQKETMAIYRNGGVDSITCYSRDGKSLPVANFYRFVIAALQVESDAERVVEHAIRLIQSVRRDLSRRQLHLFIYESLESLLAEGWVKGDVNKKRPFLEMFTPEEASMLHPNRDNITV